MEKIILFGAGLHALTCVDILEKQGRYEILGYIDSIKPPGTLVADYPVLGQHADISKVLSENNLHTGLISIGDNWSRYQVYQEICRMVPDFSFVNAIHPDVVMGKETKLGQGNVFSAGCIISPGSVIGDFCLLSNAVKLGLKNTLGNFSSVSVGSITGGLVRLESFAAITMGVTVLDRVKIGKHTIVGAGSLVVNSLPDEVLVYGHPAKIIRERSPGDAYLRVGKDLRKTLL